MLQKIRRVINANRLYSLMAVFIILIQASVLFAHSEKYRTDKEPVLTKEEFNLRIEKRQEALKELMLTNKELATNIGLIFLLIMSLFIMGFIFFTDYIIKRRKDNIELISRTLDTPTALWGLGDVLRIIILFLFFSYMFSAYDYILRRLFFVEGLDRRMNLTVSTGYMDLLVIMFVFRFVIVKYRQGINAVGISLKNFSKNIGIALYSYIAFLPILAVIVLAVIAIAKFLNYTPPVEPIYELIFEENRPFILIIISILVSLIGPVAEEIFFRGFLYGALRKSLGISKAIFLSALFFSLLHTNPFGFIPIAGLGIFLAYLREKTGSLIPSISVHIIHNSALASLMFLMRYLTSGFVQ